MSEWIQLAWIAAALLVSVLAHRSFGAWLALQRERTLGEAAVHEFTKAVGHQLAAIRGDIDALQKADQALFERNDTQVRNCMAEVHEVIKTFETKATANLSTIVDMQRGRMGLRTGQRG